MHPRRPTGPACPGTKQKELPSALSNRISLIAMRWRIECTYALSRRRGGVSASLSVYSKPCVPRIREQCATYSVGELHEPGKSYSTQRRKVRKDSQSLNARMKITNPMGVVSRYFPLRSSARFASLRLIDVFGMKDRSGREH